MKAQRIRTKTDREEIALSGWFDGSITYLRLAAADGSVDTISGQRLYRLARAIVKQFESAAKDKS